jgi:WS/DGAT/MGAT family acyltransferase
MSNAEAIMWAVEKDPALRSDFCNLTFLDRRPTDERLHETLQRALESIPRLRQRVIGAPMRIVPPEFADDPTLDLDAHVRVVAVPAPGDDRAVLDLCGTLAERPLDRARPLWEFTMIEGLPDGRAVLVQKIHHTITDGVGGLKLSLALVDFERDPEPTTDDHRADDGITDAGDDAGDTTEPSGPDAATTALSVARDAVVDAAQRSLGAVWRTVGTAGHVVTHPSEVPGRAGDAARMLSSLQRQALLTDSARSDVMVDRSLRRHFEIHEIPFEPLRAAATKLGGSVNDVFVTGLASALGRYHERAESGIDQLRVAMPINTRRSGDTSSTNSFVPARVLVPIQPAHDLYALFDEVHERLHFAKEESALTAAEGLAGVISGLPTAVLVTMTRSQTRTIDFGASNLRGSPVPLYLAGTRILGSYPMGPRSGCALTVTMLSYCDEVHLGLNIDPAAIVDVDAFMDDVRDAYAELCSFA